MTVELKKEQIYPVNLYPGQVVLNGKYIGEMEDEDMGAQQVFKSLTEEYILVDSAHIEKDTSRSEFGIITHQGGSSFQVKVIPEKDIFMVKGLQKLIGESK